MFRVISSRASGSISNLHCATCTANRIHRFEQKHTSISSKCGQQPWLPVISRQLHVTPLVGADWVWRPRDNISLWGRTLNRLGFTDIPKSILKQSGYLMYMKVADEIDYKKFFKQCKLPDTYASWYIVVELHVWLLSARLMQDGKDGKITRTSLVKAMWEDNELKSKRLEGAISSARKKELQTLGYQFHASLFAYDEGLAGSDYILAGALWRRFQLSGSSDESDSITPTLQPQQFGSSGKQQEISDSVKALEMLVLYVRTQFCMLNDLSREQLLRKRAFQWASFDDTLYEVAEKMETVGNRGDTRNAQSQGGRG